MVGPVDVLRVHDLSVLASLWEGEKKASVIASLSYYKYTHHNSLTLIIQTVVTTSVCGAAALVCACVLTLDLYNKPISLAVCVFNWGQTEPSTWCLSFKYLTLLLPVTNNCWLLQVRGNYRPLLLQVRGTHYELFEILLYVHTCTHTYTCMWQFYTV